MNTAADIWNFIETLPTPSMGVGTYLVVSIVAIIIGASVLSGNERG